MKAGLAAAARCGGSALAGRLRLSVAALGVLLLVACVHAPLDTDGTQGPPAVDVPAEPPPEGVARGPALRPLSRQPGTPADAPRSRVPLISYELAEGRSEEEEAADAEQQVEADEAPGEVFQRGGASWYGIQFHQRLTANGERFDMGAFTAAHKTLPFNSRVCVRSLVNRREVLVRVNDRGPFVPSRVIDLSRAAAEAIGMVDLGIKQVALTLIGPEGGRCAGEDVAALDDAPEPAPSARASAPSARAAVPQARRTASQVRTRARPARAQSAPRAAAARRR